MKAFIRENATLALGLGLPLLLVFLLWAANEWNQRNATPPHYDMLFTSEQYSYSNGMRFTVEDGKLKAVFVGKGSGNHPKLYRYFASSGTVKEIPYTIPVELTLARAVDTQGADDAQKDAVTPIPVPGTERLRLDAGGLSPDGFSFSNDYRSRPLLGDLFFSSGSSGYAIILKKGSYRKIIDMPERYNYSNQLVGWILPEN